MLGQSPHTLRHRGPGQGLSFACVDLPLCCFRQNHHSEPTTLVLTTWARRPFYTYWLVRHSFTFQRTLTYSQWLLPVRGEFCKSLFLLRYCGHRFGFCSINSSLLISHFANITHTVGVERKAIRITTEIPKDHNSHIQRQQERFRLRGERASIHYKLEKH